jgi:sugar (pentulose or hexulose) kinase
VIVAPGMNKHKLYEKYYSIFKNLYQPLKESMHQLQQINN